MNKNTSSGQSASSLLNSLGLGESEWRTQGIAPQTLVGIYHDFLRRKAELLEIAAQTAQSLQHLPEVHAVRYRVKDPLHLLRKVIRKKSEYPDRHIDEHNYVDWINDLAGVRVLYLHKTAWHALGKHIQATWELKRPPFAYISPGTATTIIQEFEKAGVNIRLHDHGYRAVHFVVSTQPKRQRYFAEIQLRTLFEEGWSEIDHKVRYPDHSCNAFVRDLLNLLNHFTGQADQLASFIKTVLEKLHGHTPLTEKERAQLHTQVNQFTIPDTEKQRLYLHLNALQRKNS
ncbi:RelA/SpoT domain-containing protein [Pontibacter lucknowensis]|uniref:PpGpp synthetase catalytic domain-containing protein (RelA/SpoT-type nucleotidyltranferase) n=1 Tax=Pontibacter lucknowensis TaxID=1077936 RepID=A0A1N6UFX0_9BACT|nr:RelA/SpoT domain-containing protein [Pontibacter lucknowensis]SIQ64519.1 ppGpp synthetase catalytic domain-containing protein (RelA/SpoT-type nucleotidyltranferase) [Pontibacter lucknowensis]